ncbi:transposase [Bacillus cytotoxicus]|uniref:transposase n=1 Tax=Bacillus cytotoxicus TaxID=580165 RepID=UPI000B35521D|nr:transposase [Bacillus cytotoxicus]AWC39272.1 hypothetical protein CG480_001080 [Bacillus cytotoxicus]AWC47203.1 hypothetical protein CG478_001080 [Bacillus cytotoxicus]AWC51224.1 hypothetical protein CG477_001080 [Bacillus cytotoxicus]AWC55353.1 hypothetical protein CG476_001080 [Bacillus cytotoxicus]AWC63476.1 hypothetical protein CG475_001080 [Bacillus cytotoxicus]
MFKNYNMNQFVLPLDLEVKLPKNDIAFHVHYLVESIPSEAFEPFLRNEGCPAYHPRMMLKIILCAYTQSVFSITYNMYVKEQKKKYKQNEFHTTNWEYDKENNRYTCPNQKQLVFKYRTTKTDQYHFTREFKVYECEDCSGCPFRSLCTKAKEGNHRKLMVNEKREQQKEYVRTKLSEEKTSTIYRQRKIDVEPVFGFLKANLRFTRFSVRGKPKIENEMGLA